jgi:hypothetical protein
MIDHAEPTISVAASRFGWLTPEALGRVRGVLLAITLFVGLAVYVFYSVAPVVERPDAFVTRLRGMGILTWAYALAQMLDLRFYNSRFARRRRESLGLPDSVHGLLFGQMIAWYGILYYGITGDFRPFVAGLGILAVAFWVFPIRRGGTP